MTPETAEVASQLREELERAEARLRELRDSNAALEAKLLRPSAFRTAALVTMLAGLLLGTATYRVGAIRGERRASRDGAAAEAAHAARMADERIILDACRLATEKVKLDLQRCAKDRDELNELVRDRQPKPSPRETPPCTCQVGDPLCSCL
jgi:hypothetical protein